MKHSISVRLEALDQQKLEAYQKFRAAETGIATFSQQQAALELLRLGLEVKRWAVEAREREQ
jgi:hypothetical protein